MLFTIMATVVACLFLVRQQQLHMMCRISISLEHVLQHVLVGIERGRPGAAAFGKSIERGTKRRAKQRFLTYFRTRLMTWHPACLGEKPNLLRIGTTPCHAVDACGGSGGPYLLFV